ncbi:selenoprotein S [Gadus morhua]|uniref:Selenoprotein S n=1 Tax=Gadus morhua TaxID=8049 RepID=A0A8C4Z2B3_GADMO|nr:selenoprotein S [Gadus morhua]XP_056464378.1 selenoprotein S [Gadus chalcogrammus]
MGTQMDDVQIIDVNEDGEEEEAPVMHRSSLGNQDLGFIRQTAEEILAEYGWHLLFLTVCIIVLIQYLSKKRAIQVSKRSSNETAQDPALIVRRQEALEASRRRLQEDLDAKAAEYKEKQKKLEEEKRKQKIEIWESMQEGKSYKAKNSSQAEEASSSSGVLKPKSDNKLRGSGYNPLAGDGGASVSWRPGRRGPTSGG